MKVKHPSEMMQEMQDRKANNKKMHENIAVLSEMLRSRTRAFEILLVRSGLKPCARIAVGEDACDDFEQLLNELGLEGKKSDFKVIMEFRGLYSTKGSLVSPDNSAKGHFFYYIATDEKTALNASNAEKRQDPESLGRILGYPKCCINFFIENRNFQLASENDYILPALRADEKREFSFLLNVFARYFDFALVSHSPHRLDCRESERMAQKNFDWLMRQDETMGLTYQRFMCGVGIYLDDGVVYLPRAELEGKKIFYDKVLTSPSNHPISKLFDGKTASIEDDILVISEKKIRVRDWAYFS